MELLNYGKTTTELFNSIDGFVVPVGGYIEMVNNGIQNEAPPSIICVLLILLIQKDIQSASNLLSSIPESTSTLLFRSILKCGLSSGTEKQKIDTLIESIPLEKLELSLSSEPAILLWIYSRLIKYRTQTISQKVSSLKKVHYSNYEPSINTPFDEFILNCFYNIHFVEILYAYDEGKFSICSIKSDPFIRFLFQGDTKAVNNWLISNQTNVVEMISISFKSFILQPVNYQKFIFWRILTNFFIKSPSATNAEVNKILSKVDPRLLNLISTLSSNDLIPLSASLQETLIQLFDEKYITLATESIINMNLIQISFKFSSVKISTIEMLLNLPHDSNSILQKILTLKMKKLIFVDIDEISQCLNFNHSLPPHVTDLKNEIFNDLNKIDSSYLNKLI